MELTKNVVSDVIHFKVGDAMAVAPVQNSGRIQYRKTSESTFIDLPGKNTSSGYSDSYLVVSSDGSFEYLCGHNYGGGYICLIEGDYVLKNASASNPAHAVVPNR